MVARGFIRQPEFSQFAPEHAVRTFETFRALVSRVPSRH